MPHRIALKDLKEIVKERTFVSVIVLLLFIASFSSVLTLGLLILYNPEAVGYTPSARIAVVGNCTIRGECMSVEKAVQSFNSGRVDAVVVMEKMRDGKVYARIILPENEIKAIQALMYIKKELINYERELRWEVGIPEFSIKVFMNGRELNVPGGSSMVFRFIYFILIPLLVITTAVIAAGITIDSVCEEIESGTLELLLTSPLSNARISISKILAPLTFSSILIPVWLVLLMLNRVGIFNFPMVYLSSISLSALFITLAYVVSAFFGDRERSQLIFSIIAAGSLPFLISKRLSPAIIAGRLAAGSFIDPVMLLLTVILLTTPFLAVIISGIGMKIK